MQKYRFFYVSNPADHFQLIEQQLKTSQTTPYLTILVAFKFQEMQLIERIFRTILNANIRSKHHLVCNCQLRYIDIFVAKCFGSTPLSFLGKLSGSDRKPLTYEDATLTKINVVYCRNNFSDVT